MISVEKKICLLAGIGMLGMVLFLLCSVSAWSEQSGERHIVILETMPVPVILEYSNWCRAELLALGYQEENIEVIKAQGDRELAERLLRASMARRRPDIVISLATLASQAAHAVLEGTDIPLVFAVVADPVGAGLVDMVGTASGTNVTGLVHSMFRESKVDMVMQLVGQVHPLKPVRFGVVRSDYPSSEGDMANLESITAKNDAVEFVEHVFPYQQMPQGLEAMLGMAREGLEELEPRIDYWWQITGPLGEFAPFTALFLENSDKSIALGNTVDSVKAGVLMAVVTDYAAGGRETARVADAVLTDTPAGRIPVRVPQSFNLAVNIGTALDLGIVIPPDMLQLAGRHVYGAAR